MRYRHTQVAPLSILLAVIGIGLLAMAAVSKGQVALIVIGLTVGLLFILLAFCFRQLTVEDGGSHLVVRFGPLPIFGTSIPYDAITAAEPGRSRLIDGWGIHHIPGRGTTWNLWGFGCVIIHRGSKVIRIGTDEPDKLAEFLRGAIEKH